MKPEQFIRWYGIEDAKYLIEQNINCNDFEFSLDDLKRLVESVELVEVCGGLVEAKKKMNSESLRSATIEYVLYKAIRDHESIYGGGDES
ncbi:hypothetical protein [Acinetobacter pittii]|uniref:hypothetical protein n=1 Tax=Acinetobacter pittii TaxID=48296 RepID=UPI00102354A6|nr:hypothetical protein [Acinetobacter pittii]MDR9713516.1 hypothetical protein [Acinetobacter pittii]RZH36897.1 hypothetical protein EXD92_01800 [Acinetobacter pittii]HAV5536644.1 hypothetical protein [Acinetobacter baumannii]